MQLGSHRYFSMLAAGLGDDLGQFAMSSVMSRTVCRFHHISYRRIGSDSDKHARAAEAAWSREDADGQRASGLGSSTYTYPYMYLAGLRAPLRILLVRPPTPRTRMHAGVHACMTYLFVIRTRTKRTNINIYTCIRIRSIYIFHT